MGHIKKSTAGRSRKEYKKVLSTTIRKVQDQFDGMELENATIRGDMEEHADEIIGLCKQLETELDGYQFQ